MSEERVYPRLVVSNRGKLTIFNNGFVIKSIFFPTRKDAEEAIATTEHNLGRPVKHTIEDV